MPHMAATAKYGTTPTERAKSEVTMRISVKFWSKSEVEGCVGDDFDDVGYISVTHPLRPLHTFRLQKLSGDLTQRDRL